MALRYSSLAAVAAIFVVGCSNDPYPTGETSRHVDYRSYRDVTSFDPATSFNTDDGEMMDIVYPTFYRYDLLRWNPTVLEYEIGAKPPITTKLPNGIEDWSFTIRPDLRFPDDPCFPNGKGRQATAADIVYAFKRMADPATTCPVQPFISDKILGFTQFMDGFKEFGKKNYDRPLAGVFVDPKDPLTFHVRLVQHYPQLKFILAMHMT